MDSIFAIAGIVFRENLRKKIIHVFFVVAVLILLWASTFNVFELGVQIKFLKDMALFGISIIGVLITLTTTAGQLSNEMEHRTIYPLLAKPVRRWQVLVGKFLGALYVIYLNILLLGLIFLGLLYKYEGVFDITIAEAIFLIALECGVLASISLLGSTFFSTAANVTLTFLIYLLGHAKFSYADYAMHQYKTPVVHWIGSLIKNPILPPNLEYFNIREAIVRAVYIIPSHIVVVTFYGIGLIIFYLLCANYLFTRKDL